MEHLKELMREKNWAFLDVEYIQISKDHRCARKLYILTKSGCTDMEIEFYPCKQYNELELKYKRSYQFCRSKIHKLRYNPKKPSPPCSKVLSKLNEFIVYNDITLILYKGGTIEKYLCEQLDMESMNVECFNELEKAYSHDPRTEVNCYYRQLVELDCF